MRSDLDHLPANKQRELERVVQIVFEEFEDALALASHEWKKKGRILKVILYGSYARGGWVDEPHTAKGYQSDYDLLIIVNDKRLTDRVKYWAKVDDRLMREYGIAGTIKTPVNFIVHTLQEVNDGLAHGRYFFMDVARDGIALYQSDDTELHQPKPKTPHAALAMAKEYFEEWFPASMRKFKLAKDAKDQAFNKEAAFLLHQTTESLLHCVLLVVTFYTPHVHNLAFLRTQAERLDVRLVHVWPSDNRKQRAMFEKLKEAYVKARYSKHYRITEEELAWLGEQVEELGRVVHAICSERIAQLEATARQAG
ncbi:putative nucleotidyltransferase/HEPN domain-containing protein [Novosphingobium capsulatum]|uniref:Nucleotidyltransferase/HEPN domain-containing protein n=1 Tax=Novosphingobium capsulatum TaxID=13688 RepID=A0ABU1MRR6_9SPHN|nr:nucleotidyltransferase and HEPN domain-containing protein [Novosphingobium capsulatum]MDR6513030.1 putative nucleotidyltransferase/HEPN domain-containing protein [Novosphingobium capsulatum]